MILLCACEHSWLITDCSVRADSSFVNKDPASGRVYGLVLETLAIPRRRIPGGWANRKLHERYQHGIASIDDKSPYHSLTGVLSAMAWFRQLEFLKVVRRRLQAKTPNHVTISIA